MSCLAILCVLLQLSGARSNPEPIDRLRARIPVEYPSSPNVARVCGVFKNPGKTLIREIGNFLAGDILYLFPDGTYIYVVWTDVAPDVIYDKGAWSYSHGLVELVSDPDVKWNPGIDRRLVAFRRASKRNEILLLQMSHLSDFEEGTNEHPESRLLYLVMERDKSLRESQVRNLKPKLMRDLWNPEFHTLNSSSVRR